MTYARAVLMLMLVVLIVLIVLIVLMLVVLMLIVLMLVFVRFSCLRQAREAPVSVSGDASRTIVPRGGGSVALRVANVRPSWRAGATVRPKGTVADGERNSPTALRAAKALVKNQHCGQAHSQTAAAPTTQEGQTDEKGASEWWAGGQISLWSPPL